MAKGGGSRGGGGGGGGEGGGDPDEEAFLSQHEELLTLSQKELVKVRYTKVRAFYNALSELYKWLFVATAFVILIPTLPIVVMSLKRVYKEMRLEAGSALLFLGVVVIAWFGWVREI
jgi:hypothetical protein